MVEKLVLRVTDATDCTVYRGRDSVCYSVAGERGIGRRWLDFSTLAELVGHRYGGAPIIRAEVRCYVPGSPIAPLVFRGDNPAALEAWVAHLDGVVEVTP